MDPGAPVLDVPAVPVRAPGPPAETVAGLEQHDTAPAQRAFPGRGDAGKAAADDGDVVVARATHPPPRVRIAASTATAPAWLGVVSPTSTGLHSTVANPRSSNRSPTCAASRAA